MSELWGWYSYNAMGVANISMYGILPGIMYILLCCMDMDLEDDDE